MAERDDGASRVAEIVDITPGSVVVEFLVHPSMRGGDRRTAGDFPYIACSCANYQVKIIVQCAERFLDDTRLRRHSFSLRWQKPAIVRCHLHCYEGS